MRTFAAGLESVSTRECTPPTIALKKCGVPDSRTDRPRAAATETLTAFRLPGSTICFSSGGLAECNPFGNEPMRTVRLFTATCRAGRFRLALSSLSTWSTSCARSV